MLGNLPGRQLPRAKPVMLTFYDRLKDYPFTTTFYVREEEPEGTVNNMIDAVRSVSRCVLGSYKIGFHEFMIPDYRDRLASIENTVLGFQKWVVKYRTIHHRHRSFSIPGWNADLSIGATHPGIGKQGKKPDPKHPMWQSLVQAFKPIAVDRTGEAILDWVELDYRFEAWPPKGAKRR